MKRFVVRFTTEAEADLERLFAFLIEVDLLAATHAIESIRAAIALLEFSPYTCRKVFTNNSFLRELIIPFGNAGYIALFEIAPDNFVNVLAIRHQREEDYQ